MVTKNFLFLVGVSFLITQCTSIQRNSNYQPSSKAQTIVPADQIPAPPPPPALPPPPANTSSNAVVPVGLFLGPGGMRTFAHIGVLRALQRAQVPVVAVGGAEMGSIVAASFAQTKKSNEVEWQMLKLQKENMPTLSLLHRRYAPRDVEALLPFLKSAFADKTVENGALAFRCGYSDGDQTLFVSRGLVRDLLSKCVAAPPFYNLVDSDGKKWMSGAMAPGDWAGELRRAGAQFIIYVDVISKGALLPSLDKYENPSDVKALWAAVKSLSVQQHGFAHMTIEIPMDFDLSDYENRRNAILIGDQATQSYLSAALKSIGMTN